MTRKTRCVGRVKFEKEEEWVDEPVTPKWKLRALVIAGVLTVLVAGGGFWIWRAQSEELAAKAAQREAVAALTAQIKTAREAVDAPELPPTVLAQRLETLVNLQRRMVTTAGDDAVGVLDELHRTEQRLAKLRTEDLQQRSEAAEREAQTKLAAGDTEGAVTALREAVKLLRDFSGGTTGSGLYFDREVRLNQEIGRLVAEPLQTLVKRRTEEARVAVAAGKWEEALAAFREAKETQERLNREFPRSIYSDLQAVGRLDAEIASLTADGVDAQVTEHMNRARTFVQQQQRDEAVKELLAAADLQRKLNELFSRSRFVSMERLELIESERQTLLAAEPWAAARAKQQEALKHLRQRHVFNAQQAVRAGLELLEDVATRLPKAKGQDDTLRTQLAFLNVRSAELTAIQDRVFDQLLPLPGEPRALLRTEVLQADFVKLLSTNPSRNPGRALPTDSVTYQEAEEFCRRLGWALGWRVRLPTEDDMRAAAGSAGDFRNISAGLDEWIAGREGAGTAATVWGADGKITPASRTERSRARGFRFVVEVDLTRLGEAP